MLLLIVLLATLVGVILITLFVMAREILSPPRMTDGKAAYILKRLSPGDLGMAFEVRRFSVRDELSGEPIELASWWIPHPAGGEKTVVFLHGYADAKVGSIAWASTWRDLGYHILAIDLRAHGESGGTYTTAGFFERHDLDQVLNELRAQNPQQSQEIVLFGISLGGLTALATAQLRKDIAAVVLDSPVVSFRRGADKQIELLGLPLPSMAPATLRIAKWLSGADFDQIQSVTLLRTLTCPILVIQSGNDQVVSPSDAALIESAVRSRPGDLPGGEAWNIPNIAHLMALPADAEAYQARIDQFLRKVRTGFA